MKIIDRNSAEHYTWNNVCDGWILVQSPELSVISERVPPGAKEVRHYHSKSRQFFYIIEGQGTIEISGEKIILNKGQGMEIMPGISHQFINDSPFDVNFLVISQPASKDDRILN